jgi:hypothetical protein
VDLLVAQNADSTIALGALMGWFFGFNGQAKPAAFPQVSELTNYSVEGNISLG